MDGFDLFWAAYPKRRKKFDALKAWHQLQPTAALVNEMLMALAWQTRTEDWIKNDGQYVPLPATWLRAGQWMDEPSASEQATLFREYLGADCDHDTRCLSRWACGRRRQLDAMREFKKGRAS
jgi:hypothetical protein